MKLMTIKERTILISLLMSIIAVICVAAAIKKKGVEASETISFAPLTEDTTIEPVDATFETVDATFKQSKVEFCRNTAKKTISVIEFETATEVTTEVTEATTEIVDETTEATTEAIYEGIPIYTVNGDLLDPKLQEYAYMCLAMLDMGFYYPTFLCQIYQESRFNQAAVSAHGAYGLCQLKDTYHDYFRQLADIPDADLVNDPYSNIYVGAFLMAYYYHQCWDVNTAISTYNTGTFDQYNADYVAQVRQWESTLQRK